MRRLLSLVAAAATTATLALAPAASAMVCYPVHINIAGEDTVITVCPPDLGPTV